jgi:hypothetical protein
MTTPEPHGCTGRDLRWPALIVILLAVVGLGASCDSVKDEIYFDDPAAELVLEGNLVREAVPGGTFYFGNVRNVGDQDATSCEVTITPLGAGDAPLGSFTTSVGTGFTEGTPTEGEEDGGEPTGSADDILEPGQLGSFSLTVPVPAGSIVSERVAFSFGQPVEDEE